MHFAHFSGVFVSIDNHIATDSYTYWEGLPTEAFMWKKYQKERSIECYSSAMLSSAHLIHPLTFGEKEMPFPVKLLRDRSTEH